VHIKVESGRDLYIPIRFPISSNQMLSAEAEYPGKQPVVATINNTPRAFRSNKSISRRSFRLRYSNLGKQMPMDESRQLQSYLDF